LGSALPKQPVRSACGRGIKLADGPGHGTRERSRSIDIQAFVPLADIDPRYWSTPYLVAPAKGADHAYALLTTALARSDRAGIAKYVMRTRQHLAALLVVDDRLVVCTMRFPDELVALGGCARRANSRRRNWRWRDS